MYLKYVTMATTTNKHCFYTPQTSLVAPPLAEGKDSPVEVVVSSERSCSDCPEQAGSEVSKKVHHDDAVTSSSCESRDSTTISSASSGSSANKTMEPPSPLSVEDSNVDVTGTTVLLSASNHSFDTTDEEEEIEVRKEDGATELFLLIEGAKWKDVCDR